MGRHSKPKNTSTPPPTTLEEYKADLPHHDVIVGPPYGEHTIDKGAPRPLIDVVNDAAKRFDEKPIERASIEARAELAELEPEPRETPLVVTLLQGFVTSANFPTAARIDAAEALLAAFAHRPEQVYYLYAAPAYEYLWRVAERRVNAEPRERVRAAVVLLKYDGANEF